MNKNTTEDESDKRKNPSHYTFWQDFCLFIPKYCITLPAVTPLHISIFINFYY